MTGRLLLIATVLMSRASGNWVDTSTGIDLKKLPLFPLTKIRSGMLKDGARERFDGIVASATADPREVRLRGVGKSGKQWDVHMCSLDEVWRADLDGNGTRDYVFFGTGPYGNGRTAPSFSLSILLMDDDGLPVPFFTAVYRGEDGLGIKHLVDLNRDGRAELLISSYDEATSDPLVGPFCSGHWTTQVYQFKGLGVEEFRGAMGGINFPFVKPWSYRSGLCAPLEKPMLKKEAAPLWEHGTPSTTELTSFIRGASENALWFAIAPVVGCKMIRLPTVVYDRAKVREIAFPSLFTSAQWDLLEAIRRAKSPVRLRGVQQLGGGDCSANLIWAGPKAPAPAIEANR